MEEQKPNYTRQFESKTTQLMGEKQAKLDPAKKLSELQQSIHEPDKKAGPKQSSSRRY